LTNIEAARRLGCPEGTVATRLLRARHRLRHRLAKHGLGVGAGLAALSATSNVSSAALPALLLVSTVRIAAAFQAGGSAAVPATVATLTKGVGKAMFMMKLRCVLATVALIGALVSGTAIWALGAQGPGPEGPLPKAVQSPPPLVTTQPIPRDAPRPNGSRRRKGKHARRIAHRQLCRPRPEPAHRPARRRGRRALAQERGAPLAGQGASRLARTMPAQRLNRRQRCWARHYVPIQRCKGSAPRHVSGWHARPGAVQWPAHEITHTVLADYFRAPVPRWADEGAAMLAEDAEEQQRHQALLRGFIDQPDRLIPLTRLLPMKDFPKDVMALYVQGHSLTRFLIEQKDRKTFLAFVKQG